MWEMQAISSSQGQHLDSIQSTDANTSHKNDIGPDDRVNDILTAASSVNLIGGPVAGCRLSGCSGGASDSSLNNNNNTHLANNCEQHTTNGHHPHHLHQHHHHHNMQIDILASGGGSAGGGGGGGGGVGVCGAVGSACPAGHSINNILGAGNSLIMASGGGPMSDGVAAAVTSVKPPMPSSNSITTVPYGVEMNSVLLDTADGMLQHPALRETRAINIGKRNLCVFPRCRFNSRIFSIDILAGANVVRKRHLLGVPRSSMSSTKRTVMSFLARAKNAQALHGGPRVTVAPTIGV